ncbi:YrbL family protein [Cellvibrio sp. NN19]|uniref:YrbL family protein n=1 Tax=Cellvibrio chitinivorans TaxID=3102792 RepID=UPI002B4080FD|nr:YrbL family protein [Cellvibrio sp. NN19]
MRESELIVVSEKIGVGTEKACYVHPYEENKVVKVPLGRVRLQTDREIRYYKKLQKRQNVSYTHMPEFYGVVSTNLGKGYIVDMVCDYDGEISKSLEWYLKNGYTLSDFSAQLEDLKSYFLNYSVIFNNDICEVNLLVKKLSPEQMQLVIIDGIGEVVFIQWPNKFYAFLRLKIERRWNRFLRRLTATASLLNAL